jgi:hypothetical protein
MRRVSSRNSSSLRARPITGRAGEDVVEHLADGTRVVVWELAGEEPWEGEDRFADGDALASAGFGTDEDYGCFDAGDEW